MFRGIGIAIGLFLLTWGAFLFCTEDVLFRFNPEWIPREGFLSQFFRVESDRLHLVVEQWVAILIGSAGGSLFIYCLGGTRRRKLAEEKPQSRS
ncbi:MAG: hypothetical protein CMJ46_05835 [Planctomyces sp.]|nr:hypothetical protein [Planctomyces sp.]